VCRQVKNPDPLAKEKPKKKSQNQKRRRGKRGGRVYANDSSMNVEWEKKGVVKPGGGKGGPMNIAMGLKSAEKSLWGELVSG